MKRVTKERSLPIGGYDLPIIGEEADRVTGAIVEEVQWDQGVLALCGGSK